jgi:hypothetical protein
LPVVRSLWITATLPEQVVIRIQLSAPQIVAHRYFDFFSGRRVLSDWHDLLLRSAQTTISTFKIMVEKRKLQFQKFQRYRKGVAIGVK